MRQIWILLGVGIVVAIAVLGWYVFAGDLIYAPRLKSEDPLTVVTAYFEAQKWGVDHVAEAAESDQMRAQRTAPNYVEPFINDVLLAKDLAIQGPNHATSFNTYNEEVQFVVTYTSRWRNEIGQSPGPRYWFVYLGRNEGEPWHVLGQGTGP